MSNATIVYGTIAIAFSFALGMLFHAWRNSSPQPDAPSAVVEGARDSDSAPSLSESGATSEERWHDEGVIRLLAALRELPDGIVLDPDCGPLLDARELTYDPLPEPSWAEDLIADLHALAGQYDAQSQDARRDPVNGDLSAYLDGKTWALRHAARMVAQGVNG